MVNYIEATLETIADKSQKSAAKIIMDMLDSREYLIRNFYYKKGGDEYTSDDDEIMVLLDCLNIFAEHPVNSESFRHVIKFEFNNYLFDLGEISEENKYLAEIDHTYTVFIYTSRAAKQHNNRFGNLYSHKGSTHYLAYNRGIFSKKDRKFSQKMEKILETIHEKERKV